MNMPQLLSRIVDHGNHLRTSSWFSRLVKVCPHGASPGSEEAYIARSLLVWWQTSCLGHIVENWFGGIEDPLTISSGEERACACICGYCTLPVGGSFDFSHIIHVAFASFLLEAESSPYRILFSKLPFFASWHPNKMLTKKTRHAFRSILIPTNLDTSPQ